MKEYLYLLMEIIVRCHNLILRLNDTFESRFTDKQLHFLVIGIIGMIMVVIIHPIFRDLAVHGHYLTLTWIYVFTLLIVLTFGIEIGQAITGHGNMEFADIMFGLVGFLCMFTVYAVIRGILKLIIYLIKK